MESSLNFSFPGLASVVDRWRMPTVDSARCGAMPHVSLLYPWAVPPADGALVDRLRQAVDGFGPLEVTFSAVCRFPAVVWLRPEPEAEIRALARSLAKRFPEYPPYGGLYPDPQPHLTVAVSDDPDLLDVIEGEVRSAVDLGSLSTVVTTVDIAERSLDRQWTVRTRIPLGR